MSEAVMNPCDVQEQLDKYVEMVQQKQNDYFETKYRKNLAILST